MPRARSSSKGQSRSGGETGHAPLHISVGEKQGVPLPDPPSSPQVELADVLEDRERPRNLRSTVSAVISSSSTPTSNQTTGPGDDPPVTSQHQLRNVGSDSNMSFGPHGTTSSSLTNMSSHSTATLSAVAAAGGRQFSSRSKHTGISSAVSSRRPSAATLNQPPTGPVPAVPNLPTSSGYMLSQPSQGKMRVRNTPHLHNTNAEPVSPSLMYWSRAPVHGMLPTRNMRAHSVNLIGDVVWLFGGCDDKGCWRDIWCFDVGGCAPSILRGFGTQS